MGKAAVKRAIQNLSEMQRKFCEYYVETGRKGKSAIRAGYPESSASVRANENLKKDACIDYISHLRKEAFKATNVDLGFIVKIAKEIATTDIEDAVEVDAEGIKVKRLHLMKPKTRTAITKIKSGAFGDEINIESKLGALNLLARVAGYIGGKHENKGSKEKKKKEKDTFTIKRVAPLDETEESSDL